MYICIVRTNRQPRICQQNCVDLKIKLACDTVILCDTTVMIRNISRFPFKHDLAGLLMIYSFNTTQTIRLRLNSNLCSRPILCHSLLNVLCFVSTILIAKVITFTLIIKCAYSQQWFVLFASPKWNCRGCRMFYGVPLIYHVPI